MSDIQTGNTFTDGDTVTAATLNAAVNAAIILEAFISGKTPISPPAPDDYVVLSTGSGLKKARVDAIPGVASVEVVSHVPSTLITPAGAQTGPAVHLDLQQNAVGGNMFLVGPPGGASGAPFYRKVVPKDQVIPFHIIPDWEIDWSISDVHYKGITATGTFVFSGATDTQTITVILGQGGANNTVSWSPAIRWENGVIPVLSPGAGRVDFFQFWFVGGNTYGKRIITNAF